MADSKGYSQLIRVNRLTKTYASGRIRVTALDEVSLEFDEGLFVAITGASGSGKSTLLNLLGGLDTPTSGTIEVKGRKISDMGKYELALYRRFGAGMIFQSFNLIQSMTAEENVGFPMQFAGISVKERHRRAKVLLGQVGLADRSLHRPGELSGGQQQRVAAARALVNDPKLILADEPTGNLDTASGAGIMELLADLHRSGRAVLVVTHDPRMARLATHKVFLLDGKVVSEKQYRSASLE